MDGMSSRPLNLRADDEIFEHSILAAGYKGYMLFVATFGYAWVFLNCAKVLSSRSTEGFSNTSIAIYMAVSASYLVYGFLRNDPVLVLSSSIAITSNIFLLVCLFIVESV